MSTRSRLPSTPRRRTRGLRFDAPPHAATIPAAAGPSRTCRDASDCPLYLCDCGSTRYAEEICGTGTCKPLAQVCSDVCGRHESAWTGEAWLENPQSSRECAAMPACRDHGECAARRVASRVDERDGKLVCVTDCRATGQCQLFGRCTGGGSDGLDCIAGRGADCSTANVCAESGACSLVDDRCAAASVADCRRGRVCASDGACTPSAGRCIAGSDDDCAAICKHTGHCSAQGGYCVATSARDCASSEDCAVNGLCGFADGACAPTADGCAASQVCATAKAYGKTCVVRGYECVGVAP